MRYARVYFCFLLLITGPFSLLLAQQENFTSFCSAFIKGYDELSIPATELDYKSNFNNIPGNEALAGQEDFFRSCSKKLELVNKKDLNKEELLRYAQLSYELSLNMERIALEKKWNDEGRKVPEDGLHSMSNYKEWYSYLVRYFTSVNISPEQVFEMGSSEVKKIQKEILTIQHTLGYTNENDFYKSLKNDTFYYSDKKQILAGYAKIDHTVRKNLKNLFLPNEINEIGVMEWPNAGPNTPPGIYLSKRDNAYGKDVFQYNFYGSKHNKRAMEWLYMHEGIPGHHLQSEVRRKTKGSELQNQFFYFGNAEGWACYIEDLGKEMGLYQNPYT
ncbi:MAG TPA: DUF885 family protein, partial [Bacteroidia bacterium]|nr:DUF885 family protein [Bacteroidia bacterium]